jgi:hypothetical protein
MPVAPSRSTSGHALSCLLIIALTRGIAEGGTPPTAHLEALQAFRDALTGSSPWTVDVGWAELANPCTAHGVSCDGEGNVEYVTVPPACIAVLHPRVDVLSAIIATATATAPSRTP